MNQINKEKIDEYYQVLYENTSSPIKKKNLKIIYDILLEQYDTNENNLTIAHIGRLSKEQGGPIAQAIRNVKGKDYKDLISFFENNVTIKNSKSINTKEYNVSDYIEDPALKAHVNLILAENKSLKNQLNILKKNMSKNFQLNYIENNEEKEISTLSNSEVDAVSKFIFNLENNNLPLMVTSIGSIKDEDGNLIANPGFVGGLKSII